MDGKGTGGYTQGCISGLRWGLEFRIEDYIYHLFIP